MLGKAAMPLFDDPEASGVWAVMQVVRSGTRRKTINALGFADIEPYIVCHRAAPSNAPSLDFWWLACCRLYGNYRCHQLWSVVFMHGNEPVRCETGVRAIVYSVRIGPLQPIFLSFQEVLDTPQPSEFVFPHLFSQNRKNSTAPPDSEPKRTRA